MYMHVFSPHCLACCRETIPPFSGSAKIYPSSILHRITSKRRLCTKYIREYRGPVHTPCMHKSLCRIGWLWLYHVPYITYICEIPGLFLWRREKKRILGTGGGRRGWWAGGGGDGGCSVSFPRIRYYRCACIHTLHSHCNCRLQCSTSLQCQLWLLNTWFKNTGSSSVLIRFLIQIVNHATTS